MAFQRSNDLDTLALEATETGKKESIKAQAYAWTQKSPDTVCDAIDTVIQVKLATFPDGWVVGKSVFIHGLGSRSSGSFIFLNKTEGEIRDIILNAKPKEKKAPPKGVVLDRMMYSRLKLLADEVDEVNKNSDELASRGAVAWATPLTQHLIISEVRSVEAFKNLHSEYVVACQQLRYNSNKNNEIKKILAFLSEPNITDKVVSNAYDLYLASMVQNG